MHYAKNKERGTSVHLTIALPTGYLSAEWGVERIFEEVQEEFDGMVEWKGVCRSGGEREGTLMYVWLMYGF